MRSRFIVTIAILFVTALVLVTGLTALHSFNSPTLHPPERPRSIGSEDDPTARERYEWLRLHDPATGQIPREIRRKELTFASTLPARSAPVPGGLMKPGSMNALISWERRGPFNVGGRTRALAVDVAGPGFLLAGGVSGGMWRSTDKGASWTMTTGPAQLHSTTCIAQDQRPGMTTTWYYGTGEVIGNSASSGGSPYRGDGIFKSVDNGQSWTPLLSTVSGTPELFDSPFDYTWNIAVGPSLTADEVYAATIGGIQRSSDGGTTWATVLGGVPMTSDRTRYTDLAVTRSGVIYATLSSATISGVGVAADAGLWRSTDGLHWTNITPPGWPASWKRVVIGVAPSDERQVYFLGETPGAGLEAIYGQDHEWHSLWKYQYIAGDGTGAGGTWENRSLSLPAFGGQSGSFSSQGSYDLVIKVKPDNDSTVFIGGVNLYRSVDGFRTDTATVMIGGYASANDNDNYAGHHPDQHALVFAPGDPSILYSGHDGGVSVTLNCTASKVAWTSLNNGYLTAQFYTVGLDHSAAGNHTLIGGTQDNGTWFTSSALGTTPWVEILGGDGAYCGVAVGRTSYYASAQSGETYRLLLNEATGQLQNYARVDPTGGTGYLFINPFILDPNRALTMYLAGGTTLWRNSNIGAIPLGSQQTTTVGWLQLSGTTVPNSTVSAIGISTENPRDRVYYGTVDGKVYRLDSANVATASTAPVDIWTGKGLPAAAFTSCIAVDPSNGDQAILVFSNYGVQSIFSTVDAGQTWTSVGGNLEQLPDGTGNGPSVRWVSVLPRGAQRLYFAGTSTGLYSTDQLNGAGTIWALEGDSLIGNVVVNMIDSRPVDGLVVAATHGNGVYSGVAGQNVAPPPAAPPVTALLPNYPNPFRNSTRIVFDLATPSRVSIAIYSITGQLVTNLLDAPLPAGARQEVLWVPRDLASGVYLCRFKTENVTQSQKLLFVK